jgi:hypothetical protein
MDLRAQRIYEAKVAGLVARMRDSGVPADQAEWLVRQFDREATARGIGRDAAAYWAEMESLLAAAVARPPRRN